MLIHQVNERNFLAEIREGQKRVQEKFAQFDALQKTNYSDQRLKQEFALLFQDPTIWAYATLFDPQNNRFKLWYFQDRIINDKHRFINVTAANQIGKSMCMCVKAAHHALFVPNASVMIISKSEQQAIMILDEIKWLLKRSRIPYNEIVGEVENRTELHLTGPHNSVSVIRCFPPTTSALGFHATLLICDEIAFWEKISELSPVEYYDQVLEPRTNQTKNWKHPFLTMGQIVFISNPNGQQGISWRAYSSDSRFHCYSYNWIAHPSNTLAEYTEAQKRLPAYRFASIYAAEYVSAQGGFITLEQYDRFTAYNCPLVIPAGSMLYLGGDFAGEDVKSKGRDFNVLYGVVQVPSKDNPSFPRLRVVYHRFWPGGTKRSVVYDEIKRLKNLPLTIAKFCYDKVGIGDSIKNDLIDQGILNEYQIESLPYSLQNKSEVFINFQGLFEMDMIEGTEIHSLREQIMGLQVEQPPGSVHLKIHHRTEGLHDDECDALANACWGAKRLSSIPVSMTFIESKPMKVIDMDECKHYELRAEDGELRCKSCAEFI